MDSIGGKCLILDKLSEPYIDEVTKQKKFGLMLIIEIHRTEMEFAMDQNSWTFLKRGLISEDFAKNLHFWRNSAFSIDNSIQILTDKARVNLSEYISRVPVSLKKLHYNIFKYSLTIYGYVQVNTA